MSSTILQTPLRPETARAGDGRAPAAAQQRVSTAAHQAFWLLRITFTVAPIVFGVDKFFNWTVHWPNYLATGSTPSSHSPAARTSCTSSAAWRSRLV